MTPDYLKLQEIAELKDALKIKALNTELLEHLQSSILYILDYSQKHEVPLPNLDRIEDSVKHANYLIELLQNNGHELPPKMQHPEPTPDKPTEPLFLLYSVTGCSDGIRPVSDNLL